MSVMFWYQAVRLLESDGSGGREGGGGGQDAQSEILSTSTISRADDSQRMKELEDTFEERYMRVTLTLINPCCFIMLCSWRYHSLRR